MNYFLPFLLASFAAACAWTILALAKGRRKGRMTGFVGAWAATTVLAAFWKAEEIPWLWPFVQGVLLVWLGAFVLLMVSAVSVWFDKAPGRVPLLGCVAWILLVNAAAGLAFLWEATVGAGGV